MVDFISEVQEELRKDDYNRWLKKYGPFALAGIFAVIAGAGYMEWDKSQKAKKARITSQAYIAASEAASDGDIETALSQFLSIAEQAPSGYSGLSVMRAAELELDKGNTSQAVALLDRAAMTFDHPRHKQLAQVKAAYILSGQGAYAEVMTRAAPLAEKDLPYEYLARELLGFAAKESGDISVARQQFSYLNTVPGVPESIQQRAKQYLDLISLETASTREAQEAALDAQSGQGAVPPAETSPDETPTTDETPDESPADRMTETPDEK